MPLPGYPEAADLSGEGAVTDVPYAGPARTFDSAAERYEQARPGYPEELFADLGRLTGMGDAPARVLEIGIGTGQATRGLLARGWRVVGLEPGPELAAVARRALGGLGDVEVVVAPFERWDGPAATFDLVFAATSWHWLSPSTALVRAARLLRPGGHLAIVTTAHVYPEDGDTFFRDVQEVYRAVGMDDGHDQPPPPDDVPAPDLPAIKGSGLFESPCVRRYLWSRRYSADEYVSLLMTYSNHIAALPEQRQGLFAGIRRLLAARTPPAVRKHYLNTLQLARRRS